MYNEELARSEGWEVVRYDRNTVMLQATTTGRFNGADFDAWEHVVKQAQSGSSMHLDALDMLDPNEKLDILAMYGWWRRPHIQEAA